MSRHRGREVLRLKAKLDYQNRLKALYDHWKTTDYWPHRGQAPILKTLREGIVKDAFFQCARNFGKSTTAAFDAVENAVIRPRSKIYLIAPFRTLAEEIYWQSKLLHDLIPPEALLPGDRGTNKSELRFYFANGSYIKLDGADNDQAVRGYKPTRLWCDEFQGWKKDTWVGMEPNLLAHDATVVKIGTPPDRPNVYTEQADYVRGKMEEDNERFFWLRRTIYDNPRIPIERIKELESGFMQRGEEAIWKREYLAQYIPGGAASVFPQFSEERHCKPIEWIASQCKGVQANV